MAGCPLTAKGRLPATRAQVRRPQHARPRSVPHTRLRREWPGRPRMSCPCRSPAQPPCTHGHTRPRNRCVRPGSGLAEGSTAAPFFLLKNQAALTGKLKAHGLWTLRAGRRYTPTCAAVTAVGPVVRARGGHQQRVRRRERRGGSVCRCCRGVPAGAHGRVFQAERVRCEGRIDGRLQPRLQFWR